MEFRVLGALEVRDGGELLALGAGPRLRGLLALFLARPNQVIPADELVEDLWGDRAPPSSTTALRVHLTRLRARLEPGRPRSVASTRLAAAAHGYRLSLAPDELDSERFERLVAVGTEAASPAVAVELLQTAVDLWRGPTYADVRDLDALRPEVTRLEELRAGALELLFDARIALGDHAASIGPLEAAVAEYPLRERLAGSLMLALYRSGRQTEALRTYARLRQRLGEELGIEPDPAVSRLEADILRHEPHLDEPRQPASVGIRSGPADRRHATTMLAVRTNAAATGDSKSFATVFEICSSHGGAPVRAGDTELVFEFTRAADAVACAVQVREQAASRPETTDALAIGLAMGEGSDPHDGEHRYSAVDDASGLAGAAGEGGILASAEVAALLGNNSPVQFEPSVAMALDGRSLLVSVGERAVMPSLDAQRVPVPELLIGGERFPFAGRVAPVGAISKLRDIVLAGEARILLIGGPAGVGKTRLVAEAAQRAYVDGWTILYGRCDEDLRVPYQPFVEVLESYLSQTSVAALRVALGPHAAELTRLVPEISDRLGDLEPPIQSDPDTERFRMFDAVAGWLEATARRHPVMLVLDDVHAATRPTLQLLRHLMRSLTHGRVLIVCTHRGMRSEPSDVLAEFLAESARSKRVERLELPGLDEDDLRELIGLATELPDVLTDVELARFLLDQTGGNAFLVEAMLRQLIETGRLGWNEPAPEGPRSVEELAVPQEVLEVVRGRLGRLAPKVADALTLASVIGRDFDLAVLGEVGDFEEDELLVAVDQATSAGLILETGFDAYRFDHALVQAALYQRMSGTRRVRLHRRIAEVLEIQRPHDVVALAHHYARAAADGDAAKGIEFATKAAQLAASRLAHDEAAELYGEALALLNETDEPARRCELLIRRGIALRLSGDTSHRRTLLDAAELAVSIGDTDRLTRAALANNRGFASASGEVDVERVLVLEAALKAVGPTDSAARARLLATLAAELTYAGDWARRLSLSDEALAMARRIDEAATLSHVLTARHYSIAVPEMLEERLRNTAEHLETSTLVSDPIDRFYALWTRAWSCLEAGDIDEANRCDTDAEEIADQVGVPLLRHLAIGRRSRRALLDGNLAEAERLAFEALRLGLSGGERDAELNFGCQMFSIRYEQGRLGDLEPAISQAVGENPGLPTIRAYLAVCLSEIGRDREAHTMLHRELAGDFAGFSYDQTWVNALALYAGACARLRDAESAAALYEKLEPWARQVTTINGMVVNGAVAHHLGALASTLDRYDDADAWFSNAAVIHDRVRAPIWSAHTKVQWSDALLRRNRNGDRTRARALLADAGATAEELGVAAIAQHIALISHTV